MARISHLKILELKSVMLKKVLKELLQLLRRMIECGTRGF
jgi:hypothetical protein